MNGLNRLNLGVFPNHRQSIHIARVFALTPEVFEVADDIFVVVEPLMLQSFSGTGTLIGVRLQHPNQEVLAILRSMRDVF